MKRSWSNSEFESGNLKYGNLKYNENRKLNKLITL